MLQARFCPKSRSRSFQGIKNFVNVDNHEVETLVRSQCTLLWVLSNLLIPLPLEKCTKNHGIHAICAGKTKRD